LCDKSKLFSKEWLCLTNDIQIRVKIGISIQILGEASLDNPCSKIDLNQKIIFKIAKNTAIVIKNIENINQIVELHKFWLIAAGAANQTQIIEKANMAIIWLRLLFETKSKSHFTISLIKYSLNIFSASIHIRKNHKRAKGNKNSTIHHNQGIKTAPIIKETFKVIAKVKGKVIKVTSQFQLFNFSYSLVFLNSFNFMRFQKSNLKCKKAKNNIQIAEIIINNTKIISKFVKYTFKLSKVGIGKSVWFVKNIKYIKNITLVHQAQSEARNNNGEYWVLLFLKNLSNIYKN
jgi:hypothetical protein